MACSGCERRRRQMAAMARRTIEAIKRSQKPPPLTDRDKKPVVSVL